MLKIIPFNSQAGEQPPGPPSHNLLFSIEEICGHLIILVYSPGQNTPTPIVLHTIKEALLTMANYMTTHLHVSSVPREIYSLEYWETELAKQRDKETVIHEPTTPEAESPKNS